MYLGRMAALPTTYHSIPDGERGIDVTLAAMKGLVRDARHSPFLRQFTQQLLQPLPQKNWMGELKRIHEFVRDQIRYVRDPVEVETVQTPEATLTLKSGDCDDKSVLVAAMLETVGHPVRFVAVGKQPGTYSHVYVETLARRNKGGERWIPVECTEPQPLGWSPAGVRARKVVHI